MTETIVKQYTKMNSEEKLKTFETEINYIKDDYLRNLASKLISELPDYFFHVAASSTGKYHPDYAQGEGGLVRHTKAAVRIAKELTRLEMYSNIATYTDYIIIALMLHDGWKHGPMNDDGSYFKWTKQDHPKVCYDWLNELANKSSNETEANVLRYISSLVLTHMGQWTLDYNTGANFAPKPQTQEQCFVHLCDYLASRKCLEFNENAEFVE